MTLIAILDYFRVQSIIKLHTNENMSLTLNSGLLEFGHQGIYKGPATDLCCDTKLT